MKKILFSDYDGTLYTSSEAIKENKDAIKKFRNSGNILCITTGRSYKLFLEAVREHDLEYDYAIINHGTAILDKDNNIIYETYFDNKLKLDIYSTISQFKLSNLESLTSVTRLCINSYEYGTTINNVSKIKVEIPYEQIDLLKIVKEELLNKYSDLVNIYVHRYITEDEKGNSLEIVPKEVNKLNTINKFLDNYGESLDVYSIGDSTNDIEMVSIDKGYCIKDSYLDVNNICLNTVEEVSDLLKKIEES